MKNFVAKGDVVDFIAPASGTVSGRGELIGTSLLLFSLTTVAVGLAVSGQRTGIINAAKLTANTWAPGDKVNWNNSTKEFQLATSTLDGAGTVVEAATSSDSVGKVALTPV